MSIALSATQFDTLKKASKYIGCLGWLDRVGSLDQCATCSERDFCERTIGAILEALK